MFLLLLWLVSTQSYSVEIFWCCYSPGAALNSWASPMQQNLIIPYWILEDLFLFPKETLGLMGGEIG